LQGAADARRRARRRTFVLQVPDNKAEAAPCDRLRKIIAGGIKHKLVIPFGSNRLDQSARPIKLSPQKADKEN